MQYRAVMGVSSLPVVYEQNCIFREYTVKNARNGHENDVYCGPSLCFVSHACTESAIFVTATGTLDTALTVLSTESNAFVRSTKTAYSSRCCSRHFSCSCLAVNIISMVLRPAWKPSDSLVVEPISSTCLDSRLRITLLSILGTHTRTHAHTHTPV